MCKKMFLILPIFFILLIKVSAVKITNIDEVNKVIKKGNIDEIEGNSYLELDYRSINSFDKKENIYKFYPRIKKIDNYYILTYQGNEYSTSNNGGSIFYSLSSDLINWSEPIEIWRPYSYYNNQSQFDRVIFANCDILPLTNGKILIYSIYHSKHNYTSNPYASGIVARQCSISNNKLECDSGTEIDEYDTNNNLIGKYDTGTIIHIGPSWEPYAFYDNNKNIVLTFSSGEPINKIDTFKHSSTGIGTIVSTDNGITWNEAKYSAFKFTGNYDNNNKNINYYTAQMAVTKLLNDGRYFSVYEMWSPSDEFNIPEGYSISGSIYSKNYDFSVSSNIKVNDVITESLNENPSYNDPRNRNDYSGNEKSFFTISNGSAPYIIQFPSGEVVVSFNQGSKQFLKLLTSLNESNNISSQNNLLQLFEKGYWGSIDLIDSHKIISTFPNTSNKSISYGEIHLNNTIIGNYNDITIDGDNFDWKTVDDTIFIGSETQAQVIIRICHNDNKLFILVERLDQDLQNLDNVVIKINIGDKVYTLELNKDENKLLDNNNNEINIESKNYIVNSDNINNNGIIHEIAIDKNNISFSKNFKLFAILNNKDNDSDLIEDIISNTNQNDINTWINIKLNDKELNEENISDEDNKDNNDNNIINNDNNIINNDESNNKENDIINIDNNTKEEIKDVPNTNKTISIILIIISLIMIITGIIIYLNELNKIKEKKEIDK